MHQRCIRTWLVLFEAVWPPATHRSETSTLRSLCLDPCAWYVKTRVPGVPRPMRINVIFSDSFAWICCRVYIYVKWSLGLIMAVDMRVCLLLSKSMYALCFTCTFTMYRPVNPVMFEIYAIPPLRTQTRYMEPWNRFTKWRTTPYKKGTLKASVPC